MLALIMLLIVMPLCFWGGYRACAKRTVDYRKRWKEALALYEDERTKTLVSPYEGLALANPLHTQRELTRLRGKQAWFSSSEQSGPRDAQKVLNTLARVDALSVRASKALDGSEREQIRLPKNVAPKITAKRLHSLGDKERYEVEGARLDSKLSVIDDLLNMNGYWTSEMLKRRAHHGID